MKSFITALAVVAALALSACSKSADAPATAAPTPQAFELVATSAKGFSVGAVMSAHTVYVLFDPQCPHCGHLWSAAQPLTAKARFIWVPVAISNGNSAPQGAALLSASNPVEAMNLHEASLLAGKGGMLVQSSIAPELEAQIRKNTEIFGQLKLESVPTLIAKHAGTGQVITHSGAMETAALAQWLGLPQ